MHDLDVEPLADGRDGRRQRDLAIGISDAMALRTVVPPPADVMKPVTSMPPSLKYPFSRATAKGTPYMPVPKCVTVRSTAPAGDTSVGDTSVRDTSVGKTGRHSPAHSPAMRPIARILPSLPFSAARAAP
jgi:hypothetical protein